jgi:hypothetical protein
MSLADRTPPTPEEYLAYGTRFSNWGRWGEDDELGTLNHITPEVRRRATRTVAEGRSISTGRPIDTHHGPRNPYPAHYFRPAGGSGGVADYFGMFFHGHSQTHIDAFAHNPDLDLKHYFNGVEIAPGGGPVGRRSAVHHWRDGIVTRGVLYDIPRLRGTEYVEPGRPVHGWDLQDAAAAQNVVPMSGDAVLIRCGLDRYLAANPDGFEEIHDGHGRLVPAGVHASCIEFLWETEASLMHWDMLDAPTRDQGIPNPAPNLFTPVQVHWVTIAHMGLPLIDNANFEPLAAACAELRRWEFLFMASPLIIEGASGSPINPIAVL